MEEKTSTSVELSITDYMDVIRRRKGTILQTFLLVLLVGIVVTFLAKPVYRAGARILVEGKTLALSQINTTDPLYQIMQPDPGHDVSTQIEILQGASVLKDVYKEAGVTPGAVNLTVKQFGTTEVIDIIVESINAKDAENFAAALPGTYRKFLTGNRHKELINATEFAESRLRDEEDKLKTAQNHLDESRKASLIYNVSAERSNKLAEKNAAENALQNSKALLAVAETKLAAMSRAYNGSKSDISTKIETSNIEILQLRTKIADLKTQRASLAILFKPTHVRIRTVDAEIKDLENRLAGASPFVPTVVKGPNAVRALMSQQLLEVSTAVAALKTETAQAQLRSDLAAKRLLAFGNVEPKQAGYESQVEKASAAVAAYTKTVEDLHLRGKGLHDPITIIAPAGRAQLVEQKKLTNIVFSAVVGLLLGFGLALLSEFLDDRISNTDEAQRMVGASTLGYIPVIEDPNRRLLAAKSERKTGSYGGNTVLESYRLLRTNLQFSNIDRPISSIMVTSALPGEGKSITAVNLATAFAMAGRRVLLVDADLRRPSLHTKLAVAKHPGVTNVLLGTSTIEEALQETGVTNLRILTSGLLPPNPAELFGSNAMLCLHQDLQALCDIVIFDTPPVLAAADAQVLSASVDGVLFVLQHGMTRKSALRHATQVLKQARANILGIVFNRVDPAGKRDEHYYSYYQYYQSYTTDGPDKQAKIETQRQFEALVANNAAGGRKYGNGNGNGSEHHGDAVDDGTVVDSLDGEPVDGVAAALVDASLQAKPKEQSPMERTVVLPTRSAKPDKWSDEEKR